MSLGSTHSTAKKRHARTAFWSSLVKTKVLQLRTWRSYQLKGTCAEQVTLEAVVMQLGQTCRSCFSRRAGKVNEESSTDFTVQERNYLINLPLKHFSSMRMFSLKIRNQGNHDLASFFGIRSVCGIPELTTSRYSPLPASMRFGFPRLMLLCAARALTYGFMFPCVYHQTNHIPLCL